VQHRKIIDGLLLTLPLAGIGPALAIWPNLAPWLLSGLLVIELLAGSFVLFQRRHWIGEVRKKMGTVHFFSSASGSDNLGRGDGILLRDRVGACSFVAQPKCEHPRQRDK